LLVLTLLPAPAIAAAATETLDQSVPRPAGSPEAVIVSDTQIAAQVFTPSLTGTLTRVRVSLSRCDALQSDIIAEIRPVGPGGQPGNTLLAQATIPGGAIPTAGSDWVDVTFTSPASITARTPYALVLRADTPGTCVGWDEGTATYTRGYATTGTMTGGTETWSTLSEPKYGDQSFVFETYVTTSAAPLIETTPPSCKLTRTGTDANGQKFIEITAQDGESGLARIHVTHAGNLTLNPANSNDTTPPTFAHGTTAPVIIRATKLDQSKGSLIALRITDVDGNVTDCDPVMQTIVREKGRPTPTTFTDLPQAEGYVMLTNGDPGASSIDLFVNSKRFRVNRLRDGETRVVDVTSAMDPGNGNTISVTINGGRNASVDVLIWDGQ
jgi:hypothetical protein